MRVMFDIDGVLADWMVAFTRLGHERYGTPISSHADVRSWDEVPGLTSEQISGLWGHIGGTPSFWLDVPPLVDSEVFKRIRWLILRDGYEVYFVTARPGKRAKDVTESWLRLYLGIHTPTVLMSKWKGQVADALGADYSLEDKAENAWAVAWMTKGRTCSYLIDRPYNRSPIGSSKVIRVPTVDAYLDAIQPPPEAPLLAA